MTDNNTKKQVGQVPGVDKASEAPQKKSQGNKTQSQAVEEAKRIVTQSEQEK